jgi:hypothetical protein
MSPILKKLVYKGQSPVLVLDSPPELAALRDAFDAVHDKAKKGPYGFALAFARSLADAEKAARTAYEALADDAVFWIAYPKGTSKKYKGADINRDTCRVNVGEHGFEGVSLVSLDADWSAMRFKRKH